MKEQKYIYILEVDGSMRAYANFDSADEAMCAIRDKWKQNYCAWGKGEDGKGQTWWNFIRRKSAPKDIPEVVSFSLSEIPLIEN